MAQENSYPEPPNANHEELHRYPYGNQQQMPPTERPQHQPPAAANIQGDSRDMQGYTEANQYGQAYGQPHPSTPQQLAQRGLAVGPSHGQNGSGSSETRSKASRACDECRRKKTKCDADSDHPGTQCSACRRVNQTCAFTRPPQKRGPSRGYIKDLEHRVQGLESHLGAAAPIMQYPPSMPGNSGAYPASADYGAKKRSFDLLESSAPYNHHHHQFQEYNPQQHIPHSDDSQREDQTARTFHTPVDNPESASKMYITLAKNAHNLDLYYDVIHPLFPALHKSRLNMHSTLDHVPSSLCEAFFAALNAAVTSCHSADTGSLREATTLLEPFRLEQLGTRTLSTNLTHLQALILMIVAADNSGPSDAKKSPWYGEAERMAKCMQLNASHIFIFNDHEDSNTALGRRAWLVLAILDRWHAASMTGALQINEINAQPVDEDELLLGSQAYHLARLSDTLGQLTELFLYNGQALEHSTETHARVMYGNIENYRKSVQSRLPAMPHLHLAYLHLKLLADRHLGLYSPNATRIPGMYRPQPTPIKRGAQEIVKLLQQNPVACPLTHHWAALAAITLAEFPLDMDTVRPKLDLREALQTGQLRKTKGKVPLWDTVIAGYITKKLDHLENRGALGQLADAAVGNNPANNENVGDDTAVEDYIGPKVEWSVATIEGYLNHFE